MRIYLLAWLMMCATVSVAQPKAHDTKTIIIHPSLSIKIRTANPVVKNVTQLMVVMVITNNTNKTQLFLFDKPGKYPFATLCKIKNAAGRSVVIHESRATAEKMEYSKALLEKSIYKLYPGEWLLKEFAVSNLAVLNEKNKLPPGRYSLQIVFQGNESNIISFEVK